MKEEDEIEVVLHSPELWFIDRIRWDEIGETECSAVFGTILTKQKFLLGAPNAFLLCARAVIHTQHLTTKKTSYQTNIPSDKKINKF